MHKFGPFTRFLSRPSISRVSPIISLNAIQIVNKNASKPAVAIQTRRYASGRTKEEETLARIEVMRAQAHLGGGLKRIETQHQKVILFIILIVSNHS
jgi:hypothetical protein